LKKSENLEVFRRVPVLFTLFNLSWIPYTYCCFPDEVRTKGKKSTMVLTLLLAAMMLGSGKAFVPNLSLRFSSPLGSASPENAEKEQASKTFDDAHDFKVKDNPYQIYGMKGLGTLPSQQYQWAYRRPTHLVCLKCRKRIEIKSIFDPGTETSFQWRDEYLVPKNPADLEGSCGEVFEFRVDGYSRSIHRSILEERHPNSRLFRLVSERWEQKPFSEIPIDRYRDYFRYVLDFARDGTVCLPASLLKTCFLDALTYYGIPFDPDDVKVEIDPFVMGRALLGTKERLDGFHKGIIEGHLQKVLDDTKLKLNAVDVSDVGDLLKERADAELKLNAAVVAHSIVVFFDTQTPRVVNKSFECEPSDTLRRFVLFSCVENDFWKCCNGFLKDFGLSARFIHRPFVADITILCTFLSE
jgi:hypothetical protein